MERLQRHLCARLSYTLGRYSAYCRRCIIPHTHPTVSYQLDVIQAFDVSIQRDNDDTRYSMKIRSHVRSNTWLNDGTHVLILTHFDKLQRLSLGDALQLTDHCQPQHIVTSELTTINIITNK